MLDITISNNRIRDEMINSIWGIFKSSFKPDTTTLCMAVAGNSMDMGHDLSNMCVVIAC